MSSSPSRGVATLVTLTAICGLAARLGTPLRAETDTAADTLVQRVIAHSMRCESVRATRELRASAVNGKHLGWMAVETVAHPAGAFTWTVLNEGGSERTRHKVFHELLRAEAQAWRDGRRDSGLLTTANYEFLAMPSTRLGSLQLRLKPRRRDPRLVDGVLTVTSDGYPILLEGRLAKSPSFWVKTATVVKHFGRFAGVALPTAVDSIAEIRFIGRATMTMRYHYREVNGRAVSQVVESSTHVLPKLPPHGRAPR